MVTHTFVLLFWIHNMYTFLHKKKKTFYRTGFLKILTQQTSRLFFSSTSFAHFV